MELLLEKQHEKWQIHFIDRSNFRIIIDEEKSNRRRRTKRTDSMKSKTRRKKYTSEENDRKTKHSCSEKGETPLCDDYEDQLHSYGKNTRSQIDELTSEDDIWLNMIF